MSEKRRLQQLQVIRDLKIQQEQILAKQLAKAYQAWQHQVNTLEQLSRYQQEYAAGATAQIQAWARQNLQLFLTQLDQVLLVQAQQVAQTDITHQRMQQQWQHAHHHAQRFSEYVDEQYKRFQQQRDNQQDVEAQALFDQYKIQKNHHLI